jgi:hypothetical protein
MVPGNDLTKDASQELDAAGKALKERIIRLTAKKSSAYTALSLLKAYGSFKIGACLALNRNVYDSYASVGLGVSTLHIPRGGLTPAGEDKSFYKIPSPESLSLNFFSPGMSIWIFVLSYPADASAPVSSQENKKPAGYLLLVVEEQNSSFKPELIECILSDAREIFMPSDQKSLPEIQIPEGFDLELPKETATADATETTATDAPELSAEETAAAPPILPQEAETPDAVPEKIAEYIRANPVFQGILLEIPGTYTKNSKTTFAEQLMIMAGALGTVLLLPSKRVLILIPPKFDRELLAHRLSMSLYTEVLACFEADTQDKALEFIRPYL